MFVRRIVIGGSFRLTRGGQLHPETFGRSAAERVIVE